MVVPQHVIVLDFETYYAKDYTLEDLTTTEYVLDSRFQVIGFAYSLDGQRPQWHSSDHATLAMLLRTLPFDDAVVVCHNAIFDGAILEWVFGIRPARYFCTMMGSRPYVAPYRGKVSLAACAEHFQVGVKGKEVLNFIGMRREDFSPTQLAAYGAYCCNDVGLTIPIYQALIRRLPADEQQILDLTIKKFTRPRLRLDADKIKSRLEEVQVDKAKALLALPNGVSKDDLMSNLRFANVLEKLGVAVPRKLSATTGLPTYAFAKTDTDFIALRNHHDPKVRALIEARLLWKSTLEETRLERFLSISQLTDFLPVALLYYGAHTGRFSGLDKLNLQNLPRGGDLRKAIVAPPGWKVVTADLSQIEARIVATLAEQWDLVLAFANGEDIYSSFATTAYGYQVAKKSHPTERFVGKTCVLGLGYGMGAPKLLATLIAQAAKQGIVLVNMNEQVSDRLVKTYRRTYFKIPQLWKQMDRLLSYMVEGGQHRWKMLTIKPGRIELPNGMPLIYPKIARDSMNQIFYEGYVGKGGKARIPMWGGALLENVVQALAQIILKRAELRLTHAGLPAALQVHDELVYVVPDPWVDRVKQAVTKALLAPVDWLPQLPLACEVGVGQSYGDAK